MMMKFTTPIIISVTKRVEYLPYMINSLFASDLMGSGLFIHSNWDCLAYYYNTKYNKVLQRQLEYLNIPEINTQLQPFDKYFNITVANQDLYHIQKVKQILFQYFTELNTDYLIYLKDDIIFNKDWLKELLRLYDKLKDNLGFIAGCDLNTKLYQPNYVQTEQNKERGYIPIKTNKDGRYGSSQCYLITREFYNKWRNSELPLRIAFNSSFNESTDFILNQASVALGFQNYLMVPQYVQHIGVHSTRFQRKTMPFTHDFKSPYCYGHFIQVKHDN